MEQRNEFLPIRIRTDLKRRLEERAAKERRNRSAMARILIEDGLDRLDARDAMTAVAPQPELHRALIDAGVEYQTGGDDG